MQHPVKFTDKLFGVALVAFLVQEVISSAVVLTVLVISGLGSVGFRVFRRTPSH